ncbi:MAG TPA: 30S ribosomal protein S1 [Polyangiaceae bacterium]|nr:MAG: 30S ribosomal protein S1 [Deltaproteobacteria bacterium ADurb.Bin207]HNT00155.1 30S ribosomal protein S1 [Polyangiaceae bacterium]HNZ25437.1 30S ribosomal protein S1 [Polyangiaceae bacterium]HOD25253.1 30S ribosomal protein S1 [Polyangiaceae bacterium]HOE51425.1 30S ribosomal protein S1 [Polyangiaceae bacterium]
MTDQIEMTPEEGSQEESFASLFEQTTAASGFGKEGEIVKGRVIQIARDHVVVDIGGKSEGVIPLSEFSDGSEKALSPGELVDVFIEARENDDGLVSLSKEKADKMKVWDEISAACERDEIIDGTISQRVKGGLQVTIRGGVKAFLPGSQVDLRPIRNLDKLIGQTHQFKVIKFNKKRGNIVLSRRVLLEKERDEMKAKTLETLSEGQTVIGTIKNITEYGAFVDLGGIDGLLHITDMSWGRVNHPSEVFNVGDEVTVKVLKYNAETERVSLGLKQTQEDPWNHAEEAYPPGKRVHGRVMSITDYGAFVELEPGVEGLIHVSEMSWTKKVKHPSKMLEPNQDIECQVLEVDSKNKRISLGLKQLEPDPWSMFTERYHPGDKIGGRVRSLTDYGVFVGIEEGVDGMVHKSDLSWTVKVNNPGDLFHKNDEVEAIILSINHDDKKVSLGVKQMWDDPWPDMLTNFPPGKVLQAKVVSIVDYGIFVRMADGIEGLIPISEVVEDENNKIKLGDEVEAEISNVDVVDRRITLTMKDIGQHPVQEIAAPKAAQASTLGALIREKLGDKLDLKK